MVKTGILKLDLNTGISQLDSGIESTRLAKQGPGDPFGNATDFLMSNRGRRPGDFIWVTGSDGVSSGVQVIFITDAGLAEHAVAVLTSAEALSTGLFVADGSNLMKAIDRNVPLKERGSNQAKQAATKKRSANDKNNTKTRTASKASKNSPKEESSKKGSSSKNDSERTEKGAKKSG